MAKCEYCEREMKTAKGCTIKYFIDSKGKYYERITLNKDEAPNGRCHDCGVDIGSYHHPGCDMERCPKCGMQSIGCDCDLPEMSIDNK